MAGQTSGTYTFSTAFNNGRVIQQAFALMGVPATAIDREKMDNAVQQLNLLASGWGNTGPNLWAVDLQTQVLTAGTATYTVDAATLTVLDCWITSNGTDRIIEPLSRSEYAALPVKTQTGRPSAFWFDPLISPSITIWPVPDTTTTYTLNFYRSRQTQDAVAQGGLNSEMPFRWLDALVWGLAERLAFIYAPDKVPLIGARAMKAYTDAATQDTENVPMRITMNFDSYYRR